MASCRFISITISADQWRAPLPMPRSFWKSLQGMILQADYNRAERLILNWLNDRDKPLDGAREILRRIAPQLDKHWRELARQAG